MKWFISFFLFFALSSTLLAQIPYAKKLKIDGDLSDAAWQNIAWSSPFVDIRGEDFPKPEWQTQIKMAWTKKHLLVAAKIQDRHLWTTLTQDETELYHQDVFELFIDPHADGLDYYELEINAHGTTWDLALNKPYDAGGVANSDWNIDGLKKGISRQGTLNNPNDIDEGWTLELAIPWTAFFTKKKCTKRQLRKYVFAINFLRVDWDLDKQNGVYQKQLDGAHFWVWQPQGKINMHLPKKWQILTLKK